MAMFLPACLRIDTVYFHNCNLGETIENESWNIHIRKSGRLQPSFFLLKDFEFPGKIPE